MSQTRFQRLQDVFQRAATLAGGAREAYLDEACAADTELRREVEDLLERDAGAGSQVRAGVAERAADAFTEQDAVPERIGPYEILGLVGRGGMGVVYRARQENPDRVVALKVLRPALFSSKLLKRFELEKQVLARLQHRGIAQIFEAGTTDVGLGTQPWFAMELIEGQKLSAWSAGKSTRQKLELLVRLCEAVQHAHVKGVIHRDLKPDNILVETDGRPKVLDFGVARVTDSDLKLTTVQTDVKSLIGTLPYMSPEQAQGESQKLDARSDVYALGVIAYELLSGELPYDLRDKPVAVAARVIADEDHAPLSSVDRVFRGDIETIVGKALEKEPERRYATAEELASDVQRCLRDEPIQARPPSTIYQLKKFARRNKGLVAGLAMTFVILVGAVVGLSILNVRTTTAQELAEDRAKVANDVVAYLGRIVKLASPWENVGGVAGRHDMTIVEAMEAALVALDEGFFDDPLVEAKVRAMLGEVYSDMGDHTAQAKRELGKAIELFTEHEGEAASLYGARRYYGLALSESLHGQDHTPALEYALALLEDARRDLPWDSETRFHIVNDCAVYLRRANRLEEALALWRETIPDVRRAQGESGYVHLGMLNSYSASLWAHGEREEAFANMQETVRLKTAARGAKDADTLYSRHHLGNMHRHLGNFEESEAILHAVAADWEEIIGPQNGETLNAKRDLALTLLELDQPDEALELCEDVLSYVSDPGHPLCADVQLVYATALYESELYEDAEATCRDSLALQARNEGRYKCRLLLGRIQLATGEVEAGREALTKLQREAGGTLPPDHHLIADIHAALQP